MAQRKKLWTYLKIAEAVTFSSSEVGTVHFHDVGTTLNHSPGNVIHLPLVFNFSGEVSPESLVHFELTQPDIKYSGSM